MVAVGHPDYGQWPERPLGCPYSGTAHIYRIASGLIGHSGRKMVVIRYMCACAINGQESWRIADDQILDRERPRRAGIVPLALARGRGLQPGAGCGSAAERGVEDEQHEQQERDDVHARAPQTDVADLDELRIEQVQHEADAGDDPAEPGPPDDREGRPPGQWRVDRDHEDVEGHAEHGHREYSEDHRLRARDDLLAVDRSVGG